MKVVRLRAFNYLLAVAIASGLLCVAIVAFSRPVTQIASTLPDRVERPCAPVDDSVAIIVVLGQSNAANYGTGRRYAATDAVDNFDPESGKCFSAIDPLLGADGSGSSFVTRLGDILVQSGKFKRAIVVSIAIGGASVADLASIHLDRVENLIAKLHEQGLTPTHFLFEQGETDASQDTTESQYLASLTTLVRVFRSAGYQAPFYVAQATKCDEVHPKNRLAIRRAQAAAVDANLNNIRRGPDIDMIGNDGRTHGNCHMNEVGTLAQAALWAAFISHPVN
jgi:Carbohydrate esterase, sialic acid-specific acetylesterase